jgi:hypothetical protein
VITISGAASVITAPRPTTVIPRTISGTTVAGARVIRRRTRAVIARWRYDIARVAGTVVVIVATAAIVITAGIAPAVERSRRRVHIRFVVIRTSIATRKRQTQQSN